MGRHEIVLGSESATRSRKPLAHPAMAREARRAQYCRDVRHFRRGRYDRVALYNSLSCIKRYILCYIYVSSIFRYIL